MTTTYHILTGNIYPRYFLSNLLLELCRSRLVATSLIWRTLSQVIPNLSPISPSFIAFSPLSPKKQVII